MGSSQSHSTCYSIKNPDYGKVRYDPIGNRAPYVEPKRFAVIDLDRRNGLNR